MPRTRREIERDIDAARELLRSREQELHKLLHSDSWSTPEPPRPEPSYTPRVYGSKEEVFQRVKEVLTTALAVDDDEVTPEAKLSEDLGAESIDYLDIIFQLEKAFDIKIPKGELLPDNMFSNPEFVHNEKMTPKGMAELKSRMPFADLSKFAADPDIHKFRDVFTVDTLVCYVMTKLP